MWLKTKLRPVDNETALSKGKRTKRKRFRSARNAGAVIVEMAVCLPLMILVVFGCIDISGGIFRGQTLTSAAHEGALVGLRSNATEKEVADRIHTVLNARGIDDYTLNVETAGMGFENLQSGESFRIELSTMMDSTYLTTRPINVAVTALRP